VETFKILHIAPFFYGGVGIVAYMLTKEFTKIGHEVVLATPAKAPVELKKSIIQYYILRAPTLKDPLYSIQYYIFNHRKIEEIVKLEKPDIVLTHGPLAVIAKTIRNIPVISVIHGTYANEVRWMLFHPIFGLERVRYTTSIYTTYHFDMVLYRYIAKLSSVHLVAVSKNTRRELIEAGIPPNKVFSILNGVDKEVFKPMNKDHAKMLVEEVFNLKLKGKVLLHVNPGPSKGTHILVKAVAMLKKLYGENFTLLIVGRLGLRTYREHVEKMIKGLGLENHVKIVGYVENERLPTFYNAADVTIVPSYSEGAPLVIPESLACGTPVVATNVGGNAEYLRLVRLDKLLVNITKYMFSDILALKLYEVLVSNNTMAFERQTIPGWDSVALTFLNVLRYIEI